MTILAVSVTFLSIPIFALRIRERIHGPSPAEDGGSHRREKESSDVRTQSRS